MTDNSAYQATTSATKLPLPAGTRRVRLQNLGPNPVYAAATSAKCTAALGIPVSTGPGFLDLDIGNHEIYVIAATANQASPADTRWYAIG